MFDHLDYLDEAGQYKEADMLLDKYVSAANNFIHKKIRRNSPGQIIINKLDNLGFQLTDLKDDLDSSEDTQIQEKKKETNDNQATV